MEKRKKKRGDRHDATWLRDIQPMNQIMPVLMPNRCDNEAYMRVDIDTAPLHAYLDRKNEGLEEDKYTLFHLVCAAVAKTFTLRPGMNRFICSNRVYQRNNVTLAFVVKKKFADKAEEGLAFIEYEPKDTLDHFHEKIMKVIHKTRRVDQKDPTTGAMEIIHKVPHFVTVFLTKLLRWLDNRDIAPRSVVGEDPNHASVFLSNLGSIGMDCGYHHLVNWGTNSCFIVIGKIYKKKVLLENGDEEIREFLPLGVTLDERIADGYYYAKSIALIKELMAHPELLDQPADTPVEYELKR